MKKTLIALLLLIISIPIIIIGGNLYNITVFIISLIGLKEFLNIKNEKKEIPLFIKIISYISLIFLIFSNTTATTTLFSIDYRILSGIFMLHLIPTVLYHDKTKYSVNDAFYMIGGILFLGIAFSLLIMVRNQNVKYIIYLLLIGITTDAYAMITGKLVGKTILSKEISPSKTIEGMIGGILFGTFIPVVFYKTVITPEINTIEIIIKTLFLCMLGQLGDLCFSAIKRYFNKKDFSNIIPEHGGILDRFDSIIFILLGFMFII